MMRTGETVFPGKSPPLGGKSPPVGENSPPEGSPISRAQP